MKKFKNVFLLAAMAVSAVFVGCDKENDPSNDDPSDPSGGLTPPTVFDDQGLTSSVFDGKIQATVENAPSNAQVDSVRAIVRYTDSAKATNGYTVYHVLAAGKYENGSFTLNLPGTIPEQLILFSVADIPVGMTISSDANAKMTEIDMLYWFDAYKDGKSVGAFYYGDEHWAKGIFLSFVYATGNISVKGSSGVLICDMRFGKGWNKLYNIHTEQNGEITTTKPSGLKWYFESNSNF